MDLVGAVHVMLNCLNRPLCRYYLRRGFYAEYLLCVRNTIHSLCFSFSFILGPVLRGIIIDKWMHVAFTWSRENRVGKLYVDGVKTGEQRATGPPDSLDLNPTGQEVFDIGLKRDSMHKSTFHGYLRDLVVIDSAISDGEVKDIFMQSSK